jgi:hypothetical protein
MTRTGIVSADGGRGSGQTSSPSLAASSSEGAALHRPQHVAGVGERPALEVELDRRVDVARFEERRFEAQVVAHVLRPLVVADGRVDEHEPGHAISERECRLERDAAAERVADQDRGQPLADELDERELARSRRELVQVERDRLEVVVQELLLRRPSWRRGARQSGGGRRG